MKTEWSARAQRDLWRFYDRVSEDNPTVAAEWTDRFLERADAVATMPNAGREVPEFGLAQIREVLVGPYRIVYEIQKTRIWVLTLQEGHMRLRGDVLDD
jgi:plasmid stabilization system protein ParE